jgi:hypothetical protein
MLSYGWLRGDDKLTNEMFRHYRNLAFRSPIAEFSNQFEYSIIREKQGHRYNLRRVRGLKGFKRIHTFLSVWALYILTLKTNTMASGMHFNHWERKDKDWFRHEKNIRE